MTERDTILDYFEARVGTETPLPPFSLPQPIEVEKGMMKKVAWAAGDQNPLYWDEKYARKTRYGGIIAPPFFMCYLRLRGLFAARRDFALNPEPFVYPAPGTQGMRNIAAGGEIEHFQPIRPGDVINISYKLVSVKKRWSKELKKNMYILTDHYTLTNQLDELVATENKTYIRV